MRTSPDTTSTMQVTYLSEPETVHMGNTWFEIAPPDHFWVKKRFEVFRTLTKNISFSEMKFAEFGCGHGLVQYQLNHKFELTCDGYDLNVDALSQSMAKTQPRFVYNVYDQLESLKEKYNFIFLFDVLEHIEDPESFLSACMHHLNHDGYIAINVPALELLFSKYDVAAGHQKRYSLEELKQLGASQNLKLVSATYWGTTLLPIAIIRKLWVSFFQDEESVLKAGFNSPSKFINTLLYLWSSIEIVPHHFPGTSVMAVFKKA